MYTFGRENPTSLEVQRTEVILGVLRGRNAFNVSKFTHVLFLGDKLLPSSSIVPALAPTAATSNPGSNFNPSQLRAIMHILSNDPNHRIVIVRGPPGTGKTTVIAKSVQDLTDDTSEPSRTVWLLAQSNVAVKKHRREAGQRRFLGF